MEWQQRAAAAGLDDDTPVTIPFAYAEAGHLTHGYVMTIHKPQGATADIALVLADETMTGEQLYTALSRGRLRNDLHVSIDDVRIDVAHVAEAEREPLDALTGIMSRTDTKEMAIDVGGIQL